MDNMSLASFGVVKETRHERLSRLRNGECEHPENKLTVLSQLTSRNCPENHQWYMTYPVNCSKCSSIVYRWNQEQVDRFNGRIL